MLHFCAFQYFVNYYILSIQFITAHIISNWRPAQGRPLQSLRKGILFIYRLGWAQLCNSLFLQSVRNSVFICGKWTIWCFSRQTVTIHSCMNTNYKRMCFAFWVSAVLAVGVEDLFMDEPLGPSGGAKGKQWHEMMKKHVLITQLESCDWIQTAVASALFQTLAVKKKATCVSFLIHK